MLSLRIDVDREAHGCKATIDRRLPYGGVDRRHRHRPLSGLDHQRLTLVEANRKAYVQKSRVDQLHSVTNLGKNSQKGLLDWSMPAIAQGRLFVRTPVEIICYDIKGGKAQ